MKWVLFCIPIGIYLLATLWANLNLFPEGFMEYWWFDDLAHIIVFGAVGASLAYGTHILLSHWWVGIAATYMLAVTDELLQQFIPARAFSMHDFLMSCVGITIVATIIVLYQAIKRS